MKDLVPLNEKGDLISMIEETAQHGIIIIVNSVSMWNAGSRTAPWNSKTHRNTMIFL